MKKFFGCALLLIATPILAMDDAGENQAPDHFILRKRAGTKRYLNERAEKKTETGIQNRKFLKTKKAEYSPKKNG
jgi:hypothetical protein